MTLKETLIKVHLSPFHPNIALFGKLSFRIHVPYNEREVTIQVSPNIMDYHECLDQPGVQLKQSTLTVPTSQSRNLKFVLDDKAQKVRIDDTDYEIQLLSIGKEVIETQEFLYFEFFIRERLILPKWLYKYRVIDDHSLRIFSNDELYYANYRDLNDPFELAFEVTINHRPDSKVKPEVLEKLKGKIKANIESCFHPNIGFLSLTEKRDDVLMWSHYADSHTGICLEFNTSIFDSELLKEVTYGTELYCVQCQVDDKEEGVIVPVDNDEYLIGICNTKNSAWAYEKEWRDVRKSSGVQKFDPRGLTGLIFGSKTSDEQKGRILQELEKRRSRLGGESSVRIYEAQLRRGEYALDIIDTRRVI